MRCAGPAQFHHGPRTGSDQRNQRDGPTDSVDQGKKAVSAAHQMPRIRVLSTGGVPPTTINGETLYAGKTGIIGSEKGGWGAVDKNYLYMAQKLTKELNEVYAGDLAKMETKYGFNPVFVQWRQEHKTGGFEQMQLDRMQRAATAKAARLEQLAFQINYPLPSQVPHAPALPNNRLIPDS